jgi:imidazolonepropionase-like amidohydrolase
MTSKLRPASLSLLALLGLAGSVHPQAPADRPVRLAPGELWIKGVTVISPERAAPLPNAHVLVRGPRIVWVGSREPRGDTTGVTIVDGAGRFLVPGLMDSHVHLGGVPGMTPEQEATLPGMVKAYYRQLPRSYLYFGFTTVVDLNALDAAILDSLRRADWVPRIIDCGGALALANGYPMVYAPRDARFDLYRNFLYDDRQADSIPAKYLASDHTPEAAVGRVKRGGGRCVKTFYERGFDPTMGKLPVPPLSMLRRVVSASHGMGLPVLLHANSLEAHRMAVAVPVDAVAHGLWNYDQTGPLRDGIPDSVRAVLDREIRQRIAYLPTFRVLEGLRDLFDPAFLDDPHLPAALPAELLAWYHTEPAQSFKRFAGGKTDAEMLATWRSGEPGFKAPTAYIASHGGRIVFGSDTPSSPAFTNPPGLNGYLELRAMAKIGMSGAAILRAATLEGARFLKIDREQGTVAPGKSADLLLLRDDPIRSVDAYDSIEIVIVRGRAVRRSELRADVR